MELVDWSESDKHAFLWQQFTAQHTYYQQHYATASFQVVLRGDAMVGRLYVSRGPTEIRIVDIALLRSTAAMDSVPSCCETCSAKPAATEKR